MEPISLAAIAAFHFCTKSVKIIFEDKRYSGEFDVWNRSGCLCSFRSVIVYFKLVLVQTFTHNIAFSFTREKERMSLLILLGAKLGEEIKFHVFFSLFLHHNGSRSYY